MSQVSQRIATEFVPENLLMRHVPPLEWVQRRVEEYRERCETLYWAAFESGKAHDPAALEDVQCRFRVVCRAVERLAEAARHGREVHPPEELRSRVDFAFSGVRTALGSLDPDTFTRLSHYAEFRRSDGEVLFSSLLVVGDAIRRLIPVVARVYPDIYELLLSKLVLLEHPVNEETLRPIA